MSILPAYLNEKVFSFFDKVRPCEDPRSPITGESYERDFVRDECRKSKRTQIQKLLDSIKARTDLMLSKLNLGNESIDDDIILFTREEIDNSSVYVPRCK